MNSYLVFVRPRKRFDREAFEALMCSCPHWAMFQPCLWLVAADGNASGCGLRDRIRWAAGDDCGILVIAVSGAGWSARNMDRALTGWMADHL